MAESAPTSCPEQQGYCSVGYARVVEQSEKFDSIKYQNRRSAQLICDPKSIPIFSIISLHRDPKYIQIFLCYSTHSFLIQTINLLFADKKRATFDAKVARLRLENDRLTV